MLDQICDRANSLRAPPRTTPARKLDREHVTVLEEILMRLILERLRRRRTLDQSRNGSTVANETRAVQRYRKRF
jgi:hypothetical protein